MTNQMNIALVAIDKYLQCKERNIEEARSLAEQYLDLQQKLDHLTQYSHDLITDILNRLEKMI